MIAMQTNLTRRSFLRTSALATAGVALSARTWAQSAGANGDIRVAVVGLNGRGRNHLQSLQRVKGVRVVTVETAGWAALAGLTSGDILLAIDGQPIESVATLKDRLAALRMAQPRRVTFFVRRGIYTEFLELEPRW